MTVISWLGSQWIAVWPNLLANVIWIPMVFAWQHIHIKKVLANHHQNFLDALREEIAGAFGDSGTEDLQQPRPADRDHPWTEGPEVAASGLGGSPDRS